MRRRIVNLKIEESTVQMVKSRVIYYLSPIIAFSGHAHFRRLLPGNQAPRIKEDMAGICYLGDIFTVFWKYETSYVV